MRDKAGGYTIAFLALGLNICYPSEHKLLKQRIEENGLLLSEYPSNTSAKSFRFPKRNPIIAAYQEKYIPEAGRGNGALITAYYGEKFGRVIKKYMLSDSSLFGIRSQGGQNRINLRKID